jgi:hypothetical protein
VEHTEEESGNRQEQPNPGFFIFGNVTSLEKASPHLPGRSGLHHFERKCVDPQKQAFKLVGNFYQCGEKCSPGDIFINAHKKIYFLGLRKTPKLVDLTVDVKMVCKTEVIMNEPRPGLGSRGADEETRTPGRRFTKPLLYH